MDQLQTKCLHSDSKIKFESSDVSAPIHISTTFNYHENYNYNQAVNRNLSPYPIINNNETTSNDNAHIYSRDSTETRTRLESVLGALENAHAVTYSSGLAAIFALLQHVQPLHIIMSKEGYHGTHGVVDLYCKNRNVKIDFYDTVPGYDIFKTIKKGLVLLESPQNPRGEVVDLEAIVPLLSDNVVVAVDATFAPPPLQSLLSHGVDIVMHSTTKSLGGHSDLLGGVLMTKSKDVYEQLLHDRMFLGSVMGNLECWLLLRSLRTLKIRVLQQSQTATQLTTWLTSNSEPCLSIIAKVHHASIPTHPGHDAYLRQGTSNFPSVLSIDFITHNHARLICSHLRLFHNATSLGGVESLIEWRAAVDPKIDPRLCRVSIGLEEFVDLQADLRLGFLKVLQLVGDHQP
ncbi:hypothetical protein HDV02_006392 [Globomyces sp. JEL0801]|nr:hypothetical protein HDV02_006392 [Globomyces sp. JEL0801]